MYDNTSEYLSNLNKTHKYFSYHKELSRQDYKIIKEKYAIIFDAQQSFYFRSILYLCNFLKPGDLYLGNLLNSYSPSEEIHKKITANIKGIKTNTYFKNLFNLRDKWISHRDKNWAMHSQDFPDEVFELYFNIVKDSIDTALSITTRLNTNKDLSQLKCLLEKLRE